MMKHAMFENQDAGGVIGYMCRTDFECELGAAAGGNCVFPSVEDLKESRQCHKACGIVEVLVSFREIVEPGSDPS